MKVRELIEKLQELDGDDNVYITYPDDMHDYYSPDTIEKTALAKVSSKQSHVYLIYEENECHPEDIIERLKGVVIS